MIYDSLGKRKQWGREEDRRGKCRERDESRVNREIETNEEYK